MSIENLIFAIAIMLSILPPTVFVGIRQAIKINRQEIVRDLAAVFKLPDSQDEGPIASFEFVKYKYFFNRVGDASGDQPRDHSYISWTIGAIPLILLLFVLSNVVISSLAPFVIREFTESCGALVSCTWPSDTGHKPIWIWSLCAAFAGGYVFMIRSFYRAINNFDFSPMSLVGACNNLFVGIVGAQVLTYVVLNPIVGVPELHTAIVAVVILFSFAIGYLPESATRTILWRSELGNFKRENREIYKSSLTTPVEIIDGIDTETRDRLADYHIRSTQNLATANPLMLFVETPFGVYQIMDWVAQAQLCCSVGPDALTKLWRLGIRTLFDLERVALDQACYDKRLLQRIAIILLPNNNDQRNISIVGMPPPILQEIEEEIVSNIVVRLDDPHVQRLRQIYIKIGNRLGPESRRFPYKNRRDNGNV